VALDGPKVMEKGGVSRKPVYLPITLGVHGVYLWEDAHHIH